MRLFIGIPVAGAVIAELSSACGRLRHEARDWRWMPPESWHITLQFLGKTSDEQYRCVIAALGGISLPSVSIKLGAMGFFDRAGIFFNDVEVTQRLLVLQQRVTEATEPCGFAPERRPYHPHITLARIKGKDARQEIRKLKNKIDAAKTVGTFVADVIFLYESQLGADTSKYEVRARFHLS